MIGAEAATQMVADAITARMPTKLRHLETRLALPAGTLLDPKLVLPHGIDRVGLEDWPWHAVVALRTIPPLKLVDTTPAGVAVYAVRYALRIYTWTRGDTMASTDLTRKRHVLALRELLLERLGLDPDVAYLDVHTIEESYSDVAIEDGHRTIAGAYTAVELILIETPEGPAPFGTVEVVDVDTAPLPPHPAL